MLGERRRPRISGRRTSIQVILPTSTPASLSLSSLSGKAGDSHQSASGPRPIHYNNLVIAILAILINSHSPNPDISRPQTHLIEGRRYGSKGKKVSNSSLMSPESKTDGFDLDWVGVEDEEPWTEMRDWLLEYWTLVLCINMWCTIFAN